jgi:hypothetical protein
MGNWRLWGLRIPAHLRQYFTLSHVFRAESKLSEWTPRTVRTVRVESKDSPRTVRAVRVKQNFLLFSDSARTLLGLC